MSSQTHHNLADLFGPLHVGQHTPTGYAAASTIAAPAAPYDGAGDQRGRRRTIPPTHWGEDQLLPPYQRARAQANARDITRNFAVAAWAIRRHLDYVAEHDFQATTPDKAYNKYLERYVSDWAKPGNFDRAARHDLPRYTRLAESLAVVDGDQFTLRLADGTIQGIEADRIRNPGASWWGGMATTADWTHGVRTDRAGRALQYYIHARTPTGFQPERIVPAADLHQHGYFGRIDQIRGISPVIAALNSFRDIYEGFDLALAKAKVSQLFALAITRKGDDAAGDLAADETGYSVDFGRGPILLDMEPGDDAKFLGEQTPSPAFQAFTQIVCQAALKSLDIPYSFYDESHTNFFGSRGAWLHYERSAISKRRNVQALLDRLTAWRLTWAFVTGQLDLAPGLELADVLRAATWVPLGMPWWKPTEELSGDLMAIRAGLSNPERVARQRAGGDVYENLEITARVMQHAQTLGIPLSFAPLPATASTPEPNQEQAAGPAQQD